MNFEKAATEMLVLGFGYLFPKPKHVKAAVATFEVVAAYERAACIEILRKHDLEDAVNLIRSRGLPIGHSSCGHANTREYSINNGGRFRDKYSFCDDCQRRLTGETSEV